MTPMKPADKIISILAAALPGYTVVKGSGKTYDEFIAGSVVDGNAAFVSYDSFTDTESMQNGPATEPSETYTLYLRTQTDDTYDVSNAVRDYLRIPPNNEFIDAYENYRSVRIPFGSNWHHEQSGNDIIELTIYIE